MNQADSWLARHAELTRRYFLKIGLASAPAVTLLPQGVAAIEKVTELEAVIAQLESYLTKQDDFKDVSRGDPIPHSLSTEERQQVGLTQQTWSLEVTSDPEHPAELRTPLSQEAGTALDWDGLMELAQKHAVRFPKVMTCNNIGCPLGMGIWEGVPLREVIWLTQPKKDLRRVYYYGFHNEKPDQIFRSSLPIGRVLEDPFGLPPVIVCYKLNGQFLTPQRGGPVRLVVPEAYGFKSVKWLSNIVLTNLYHANDTYAGGNNDVDSWLKTFAATLSIPNQVKAGEPIPVTGYAQVGISGLAKVQTCLLHDDAPLPSQDRFLTKLPWEDAAILGPPETWGGELPGGELPDSVHGFDPASKRPLHWPMRLSKAHWAQLLPGLPPGEYTFRCRTLDENGIAQPLPRPFDKSGRNSIERVSIEVIA